MNASMKNKLTGLVTVVAIATSLAACSSHTTRATVCSLPEGPNLERAISAARVRVFLDTLFLFLLVLLVVRVPVAGT